MNLNNNPNIFSREDLREWIILNGEDNNLLEKNNFWLFLFKIKKFEALDEWLETGWDINGVDEGGRAWMHWCVLSEAPAWLVLKSWHSLNQDWWRPDQEGNTPFHLCKSQIMLQILWNRWWASRLDWRVLCTQKGLPEKENQSILEYWPTHLLGKMSDKSVDNPVVFDNLTNNKKGVLLDEPFARD